MKCEEAGLVLGGFWKPRHWIRPMAAQRDTYVTVRWSAVGETELGGRTRGEGSLWRVLGLRGRRGWGRSVCSLRRALVCVCGGGGTRHLMSCSKVLEVLCFFMLSRYVYLEY